MSKDIKPELLPLNLGGTITYVPRSKYVKHTAETFALKLSADIKRDHIIQMLEALDKGKRELPPDVPKEIVTTFDQVIEDYDDAVEEVDRRAQAEKEAKEAEEEAARAKAEEEEKTFLAIKDKTASLADLARKFDTGNMDRFVAKGKVTNDDLLVALNTGLKMGDFSNWMKGDLVVELENRGQLGVVAKLAEATGQAYANIYNAAKTARFVKPEDRVAGVSYTIFAEIANARFSKVEEEDTAKRTALLEKACAGEFTTQTARAAVQEAKGITPKDKLAPEADPKHLFIVVDPNAELKDLVQVTSGLPTERFAEGAIVIDPKTCKKFIGGRGKEKWEAIDVWTKPEPEPAPAKAAAPAKAKGKGKK